MTRVLAVEVGWLFVRWYPRGVSFSSLADTCGVKGQSKTLIELRLKLSLKTG